MKTAPGNVTMVSPYSILKSNPAKIGMHASPMDTNENAINSKKKKIFLELQYNCTILKFYNLII